MKYCVTGCAGFVGSTLTDRLLADGHSVIGIDDFSTGHEVFLTGALENARFTLVRGDLRDPAVSLAAARGCDAVFHFAANADVRHGTDHPTLDLHQNTFVTVNVLEAARINGVRDVLFSSTGSVYGEATMIPTPEDAPMPVQTSAVRGEQSGGRGVRAGVCGGLRDSRHRVSFRLSLLGERYTHGHVVDFYRQLREHPETLHILGDGKQRKSYLYVGDCIDAILVALREAPARGGVYNLGTDEFCAVNDSVGWIGETLGVTPARTYSGGRTRLDRRQPVHLSRLLADSRVGMEAEHDDP